ncbi:MAG: tetratricopeptide repeat protein [Chloroflexota bacterium]|nr:tetratricopeptide repeat protein [Chloroflexota bacterium]
MDVPPALHPPPLRAHLLGPVRLAVGDRTIPDLVWPRRSARALLLLLLATPGHRLPRDRLLDLLWPDAAPETARPALRVALHALRRVLEPDLQAGRASAYVESSGDAVALCSGTELWVDVAVFEAALARVDVTPPAERLALLRDALALYGGDLLADEPDADWPVARRERLRRAWRHAVLDLVELELGTGHPLAALPVLERLVTVDPADEPAHRALMRALAAAGGRDEALRQYTRCVAAVREELDVEPDVETVALAAEIRSACPVPSVPLAPVAPARRFDNLPASPTPLIGRERELETVQDLLLAPDVRLVTVTGPGGIGKTRLALEVAHQAVTDFADGVCFVGLAAIRDPQLVMPTVARTLGVDEVAGRPMIEVLGHTLREWELLLVLDNLEQVIEAAGDLGSLLAACPRLTILATSREPLRLRAEHVVATPPLAVPPFGLRGALGPGGARSVERYEAVTLFAERARAARPDFVLTDANASPVAALCARLDGLPLAIELAAARTRHLAPAELLARLERRLPLLTRGPRDLPQRQRTLRDVIAWSHDLLSSTERPLFRRLAVFASGFTLEVAESVCVPLDDDRTVIAEGVWALVDKSLLQREEGTDGETRFGMLETIREYGLEQLAASREEVAVREAHAAFFLTLAEEAEPRLHGGDQIPWLERLEVEHDNLRAALGWAGERRDVETVLRLSGSLAEFWRMRGHLAEGRDWLERALALGGDAPSAARALCLRGAGALAQAQGDSDQAIARLTEALDDWRVLRDERRTGQTLSLLAGIARTHGDYRRALELNEQALRLFEAMHDQPGMADTLNQLGIIAADRGEDARARELFERSRVLYDLLADRHGSARVLNNLGALAFWQEDYRQAAARYDDALVLWRAIGDRPHTAMTLANLGEALRAEGDLERAMIAAREGLQLSREVGDKRFAATALFILGSLLQHHEYDPRATDPLVEGLLLYRQVGDRLGLAWCLEALAGPATASGRPELAANLCGAAEVLRKQVGVPLKPAERPAYHRHLDAARAACPSPAAFREAWATGRALPLDAVVALAAELVSKPTPRTATATSDRAKKSLSPNHCGRQN